MEVRSFWRMCWVCWGGCGGGGWRCLEVDWERRGKGWLVAIRGLDREGIECWTC